LLFTAYLQIDISGSPMTAHTEEIRVSLHTNGGNHVCTIIASKDLLEQVNDFLRPETTDNPVVRVTRGRDGPQIISANELQKQEVLHLHFATPPDKYIETPNIESSNSQVTTRQEGAHSCSRVCWGSSLVDSSPSLSKGDPRGCFFGCNLFGEEEAPDYASPDWWIGHPQHHGNRCERHLPTRVWRLGADGMWSEEEVDVRTTEKPADLFFIHGTQMFEEDYNVRSPLKDAQNNEALHQATAFDHVCQTYMPFYRQATFSGGNWDFAYKDIRAAFRSFLEERRRSSGQKRPIVLAGHSQGSGLLEYLLNEFFSAGSDLLPYLAVCYAPGVLGVDAPDVPDTPRGAWNKMHVGSKAVWCTATWDAEWGNTLPGQCGEGQSIDPSEWGRGAAIQILGVDEQDKPILYVGLVKAIQVNEGLLGVKASSKAADAILECFRDGKDYHKSDMHLFWDDVRWHCQKCVEYRLTASV